MEKIHVKGVLNLELSVYIQLKERREALPQKINPLINYTNKPKSSRLIITLLPIKSMWTQAQALLNPSLILWTLLISTMSAISWLVMAVL